MGPMRDFWAREWLLRCIAMRHDNHKLDEIIKIATLLDTYVVTAI